MSGADERHAKPVAELLSLDVSTSEWRDLAAFRGLLDATSVAEAMAHVAAIASASAGADLAAVFLRVDGEARLRLVAGDGCPAGLVGTLELALGEGAPAAQAVATAGAGALHRGRGAPGLGDGIRSSRPSSRGSQFRSSVPGSRSARC
jgi:hypothetical protein